MEFSAQNMASKSETDSENTVSSEGIESSEVLSRTEDKIGAFIKDVTCRVRTRGVKPFKKCKSATFKVDGTFFTIGKEIVWFCFNLGLSLGIYSPVFPHCKSYMVWRYGIEILINQAN